MIYENNPEEDFLELENPILNDSQYLELKYNTTMRYFVLHGESRYHEIPKNTRVELVKQNEFHPNIYDALVKSWGETNDPIILNIKDEIFTMIVNINNFTFIVD